MSDARLRAAILALSALGAAVAAYLTVAHLADARVACATGGCETVQGSRYAEVGGVPVAAIGLAGYLVLAASAASARDLARAAGLAAALAGAAVAAYLLYVQAALLGAYCQWCLASDAILALLLPATLVRAVRGGRPDG